MEPRLDYATAAPVWRRRRARQWLVLAAVAGLALAGWRGWPIARERVRVAYLQHRCATYAAPADRVVYDDDPATFQALAAQPGYVTGYVTGSSPWPVMPPTGVGWQEPNDWTAFRAAVTRGTPYAILILDDGIGPFGPDAMLFLHARRTRGGGRRIVAVWREGEVIRVPIGDNLTLYRYEIIEPSRWGRPRFVKSIRVPAAPAFPSVDRVRGAASPMARGKFVRFFAGQPDPADDSRFVLPYEVGGTRGEVAVRLVGEGDDAALRFDGP